VLVQTAKAWGKKPSELGICGEEDDLAYMITWEQSESRMIAWERQEAEREAKRGKNRA
jgi:hypothetical protein